jgi:hypothetical protein
LVSYIKEEYRLRELQNKATRKTLGLNNSKETQGWIKLCKKELHGLHSSANINGLKMEYVG